MLFRTREAEPAASTKAETAKPCGTAHMALLFLALIPGKCGQETSLHGPNPLQCQTGAQNPNRCQPA